MISEINKIRNKYVIPNASWQYKINFFFLMLFVLSLPFTGIEWDLLSINRFEIKITMITFPLLFIGWLLGNLKFPRRRDSKEILFYFFAFMYGMSQFTSLINSPLPSDSIKQGIIILSLLTMMIVVSETILDKKMCEYVLITIGTLSLLIGIAAALNYYFIGGYGSSRLGASDVPVLGIISLRGDPSYFGDILLYSIGSVFFVVLKVSERKYWRWLMLFLLMFWFLAIALTFTKALVLSVLCFFVCSILLLREKRRFMVLCTILFIAVVTLTVASNSYFRVLSKQKTVLIQTMKKDMMVLNRMNMFSTSGMNSLTIRLKAIEVSIKNSLTNMWFGNGAGLSQKLLPEMGTEYDRTVDDEKRALMKRKWIYGEAASKSMIDSHVFFLTEFFNVGLVGVIPLICLIIFVILEQIKTIKISKDENDNINELLFATLISMLVHRLTGSFVVIPFLWFMLGLSFGVCKLYRKASSVSVQKIENTVVGR